MVDMTERYIYECLLDCGIRPHLIGYAPIFEAIRELANADRRQHIPYAVLMDRVGELYGLRNSRHAVRDAIAKGTFDAEGTWSRQFAGKPRPSNTEFLYQAAEMVRDRVAMDRIYRNE